MPGYSPWLLQGEAPVNLLKQWFVYEQSNWLCVQPKTCVTDIWSTYSQTSVFSSSSQQSVFSLQRTCRAGWRQYDFCKVWPLLGSWCQCFLHFMLSFITDAVMRTMLDCPSFVGKVQHLIIYHNIQSDVFSAANHHLACCCLLSWHTFQFCQLVCWWNLGAHHCVHLMAWQNFVMQQITWLIG